MKFDISRSIYPDGKIRFIARDKDRIVRFREDTLEDIQKAIKTYKEPPPVEEEGDKGKGVSVKGEEATAGETKKEPKKKLLTNKLAEKVQKRKKEQETKHLPGGVAPRLPASGGAHLEGEGEEEKSQKKRSFWDKLK